MTAYTPGPYTRDGTLLGADLQEIDLRLDQDNGATIKGPNAEANADLFIAAPDVLAALEAVGRPETEYDGRMYSICPWCGAQDEAPCKEDCQGTQAIAKASPDKEGTP